MSRLTGSYRHPREREYRAPGGPWDVPPLDTVLTEATALRSGDVLVDVPAVDGPDDVERAATSGARLDAAGLEERVARLAGGLRAAGVRRHDVVAWQTPNWHEAVLLYRACWRLGAIAAPIHNGHGAAEIERSLAVLDPKVWLPREHIRGAASDHFGELADGVPLPASDNRGRPSDLAVVLFTSGATSEPKGVLHTQRGLAYKGRLMTGVHDLGVDDAVLMPAPLAHISGLLNGLLVPFCASMKSVLMERWNPELGLELVDRERISFMIGPTTVFVALRDAPGFTPRRVESLRLISSGAGSVTPAFVRETAAALDCIVKRTYGSTEAPTVTTSRPGDPDDRVAETEGRSTGDAELRVVDLETGRPVPAGEPGELLVRGPELFAGYVDAAQTRAAVTRGWLRTGDIATVDADGWLTIVGRIKDIIIRGGENIAATEVERVLEDHPLVQHAIAVGYPDDVFGERVCAFVVTTEPFGLDDARAWFEARGVARFKTPERVVRLDALPVLPVGKPDRNELRKLAASDPV
ncbi:MAG: AMP-dependent synthetase [Actinomycetia bacterium]|nr:AMP-dependent synthetase [Actinomycetes bacterium]